MRFVYFLFFILFLQSCSKAIVEDNQNYPVLHPRFADNDAGTWKPILITNPVEIVCPEPLFLSNPAQYQAELLEIKGLQEKMSESDKQNIQYWGAGAVLRWNEIMRELVAKHNLPPYQNADGTYPVPNANNPLAYPTFPFANPPYAARAYAYLSTSQYDALIVDYYYKEKFKTPFPSSQDSTIKTYFSNISASSFPSEDGAVIGASSEILKLLFPGDVEYIESKVKDHMQARLMGGGNTRSEIEAGIAIGKSVASKFINRAKTDGAGSAGGNAAIWNDLKQKAINRGEIPWISQENPPRPPMLPLFGNVKPFLFSTNTIVNELRPPAPPSTQSEQFKKELEEIYQITKNLSREEQAICSFWADGIRTYTPPGHWNYIASKDFVSENFSEPRWARNLALLNMSLMDAAIVCWDAKSFYFNPRPMQIDERIKTSVGLPNFPSYISGHSTFSGAAATILGHILPSHASQYSEMAKEASISRMYGGIHYRSDCEVGLSVGQKVGNYAVQRALSDGAE